MAETAPSKPAVLRRSAGGAGSMSRARAMRAPVGVAVAGAVGSLLLLVRDPHTPGSYGACPFHFLTGLWCPGCGGTRAAYDLLHLDVGAAVSSSLVAVVLAVVLVVAYVRWLPRRWRGEDARMIVLTPRWGTAVIVALAVFAVVRNTPWGAWLAP